MLGKPKNKPVVPIVSSKPKNKLKKKTSENAEVGEGLILQQQGGLQNAIVNIEEQLVVYAINKINRKTKIINAVEDYGTLFDEESNLIPNSEKSVLTNELLLVLTSFYGVILTLQGNNAMNDRIGELAMTGTFTLNSDVKRYIKSIAKKVSESHIDTISKDIYETARKAAIEGLSQEQIIGELKGRYSDMIETRAKVVARTETNRAFTRAQFEADKQFIDQNDLEGKVFKKWTTRSGNPCEFCEALEKEGLIPFNDAFRKLGSSVSIGKGKDKHILDIGFEDLEAGNAHPNCSCTYELIIKS
jgi:hypothetical protein